MVNMNFTPSPEYQIGKREDDNKNHEEIQNERIQKRAEEMVLNNDELAVSVKKMMEKDERNFIGLEEDEIAKLEKKGYDKKLIEMIVAEIAKRMVQ